MSNRLCYDIYAAHLCGVSEHPEIEMKRLGYNVLSSKPECIFDRWIFDVEEEITPLPSYVSEIKPLTSSDKINTDCMKCIPYEHGVLTNICIQNVKISEEKGAQREEES